MEYGEDMEEQMDVKLEQFLTEECSKYRTRRLRRQIETPENKDKALAAWYSYTEWVFGKWKRTHPKPKLVYWQGTNDPTYPKAAHNIDLIRYNYDNYNHLSVWSECPIHDSHPLFHEAYDTHPAYILSRAVHDIHGHLKYNLGFGVEDELRIHLRTWRRNPNKAAQKAAWTDDVGILAHWYCEGKWPDIQYPIITEPRYQELTEILGE